MGADYGLGCAPTFWIYSISFTSECVQDMCRCALNSRAGTSPVACPLLFACVDKQVLVQPVQAVKQSQDNEQRRAQES